MSDSWNPDFAERSLLFEPLRAAARALRTPHWPGCDDLNRVLASRSRTVVTGGGQPLRFVEQQLRQRSFEERYEPRIFLRGEVQVRPRNWHDLFNALTWLTFPAAKAALNQRHFHELERNRCKQGLNRGAVQDALTLFDEGGLIVAAADPALVALLTGFQWKELFWQRRAEARVSMRFYLFGHALYEKALEPFVGVTGKAVIVSVERGFSDSALAQQLSELDVRLATLLGDTTRFLTPRTLAPIPLLGVPGWCEDNALETFYDNTDYFRPGNGRNDGARL